MTLLSKVGSILRQTANKQISPELFPFKLSIHQAIRCMSSKPSPKLFIEGISYQTDEQGLREAFAKYGQVQDTRIIGIVTCASSEEASSAIQALDGKELFGRRVKVNYATDRPCSNFACSDYYACPMCCYGRVGYGGGSTGNYEGSGGDSSDSGNTFESDSSGGDGGADDVGSVGGADDDTVW